MSDTKHTELPWAVGFACRIIDAKKLSVCLAGGDGAHCSFPLEVIEANAEFIVRACNNYDALLAACEQMAGWIASKGSRPPCVRRARTAIAATKGETNE